MTLLRLDSEIFIPLAIHTVLFILVITGLVPRQIVFFWAIGLLVWASVVDTKTSIVFFVAAIPLFIAIPITPEYDNLTMSRPLSIVIFLKWFLGTYNRYDIANAIRMVFKNISTVIFRHPIGTALSLLLILSGISLFSAPDIGIGIKRIIFFTNSALVPIALFELLRRKHIKGKQILSAMLFSVVAVITVAVVQIASTYFIDIYQFMRVWGEGVQLRQFGALWSQIAIYLGNTWFAYYGPQLSLRVFSLFPDSHSFPIYLILALGAPMAFAVQALISRAGEGANLRILLKTRSSMVILWLPLGLLMVILSGTRGIWVAAAGLPFVSVVIWLILRPANAMRPLWLWLSSFLVVIALLFTVAYPIFVSPQFLLSKNNLNLFTKRVQSILDVNETSNRQRLEIWSSTISSIKKRPLLGVGIGNFPVILDQRLFLARAGSTAHNIYLQIASETGIIALMAWLLLWAAWYRSVYLRFRNGKDNLWRGYDGWLLLAIPWVAAYLMTDAALFDERTILLFGISVAIVVARQNNASSSFQHVK